jgi:hypothetical protein
LLRREGFGELVSWTVLCACNAAEAAKISSPRFSRMAFGVLRYMIIELCNYPEGRIN